MGQSGEPVSQADIERERVQFALAERAASFGYWRVCLATLNITWSAGMYRLLQLDPARQPPDREWLLAQICDADRPKVIQSIDDAIATKSPFYYRTRSAPTYHVQQIVDTHGEVELDAQGNVVAVIGVCHDVTARVTAEDERQMAQTLFQLITQYASDMILLYAPDARIVFASDAFTRITGRTIAEIEQGRFLDLVHPDDIGEAQKLRRRNVAGQTLTATYRLRHRDGHYIWLEVTTRGILDDTGAEINVVAVGRDITQRKEQELELISARKRAEAASRAKSAFLANMSHELRTPLNAIIGFTDMMIHRTFGALPQRYEEYAKLIHHSGQHLLDLISDILDMAKIEAGKLDLHFEQVEIDDIVDDCVEVMRAGAVAKGVELLVNRSSHRISLLADRRALKQILLNVVSNAVKFTPVGGQVRIAGETCGTHVVLTVSDTGIGIPEEDLPRLGRPFEQVCGDPELSKGGTGLGLSLVRALAEKHGGTVRIESRMNVGTKVIIDLPMSTSSRRSETQVPLSA